MSKINGLILHNLKKDKGQYLSFGIIILLTAFILNSALVLRQVDSAYDTKFKELQTANINICIPLVQDTDALCADCEDITGVEKVERREGLLASSTILDFRGTDFTINTAFYDLDEERELNRFQISSESEENFDKPVYLPLYIAQFGEFEVGDKITYQIDGEDYTFDVAGILEEMQYGNAGGGTLGIYLPTETYQKFADNIGQNKIAEYSMAVNDDVSLEDVKEEVNTMFSEKDIIVMSLSDSDSCKQTRTMVCSLMIVVLTTFSLIILLVSMFLCKFRIQNMIEEEMADMGVLKAIGYTGNMIICAAVLPYMIVGVVTTLPGGCASYALLPVLAQVLALQSGFSFTLDFDVLALCLTVVAILAIIFFFTYFSAGRIRKLQPINAIRGNSEGRHGKRNWFPLDKTPGSLQVNLILKQTASSAGQNVLLFMVSFLLTVLLAFTGTLFYNAVVEPDNFTSTLSEETPEIILQVKPERMQEVKKALEGEEQVEKTLEYVVDTVSVGNGSFRAFVCEDFQMVANDLCYEGRNPLNDNEIAIGSALADEYAIGDTIEVKYGDIVYAYDIVGLVQSVNLQGEICELTKEGYLHINDGYESQSLYLYLQKQADVETVLEEIDDKYAEDIVASNNYDKLTKTAQEMYSGIVVAVVSVVFILTVLIALLILYIIIKSLIVRRKQELGIYKAMGYSNRQLMMQIVGSFLPVSFLAVLSAALLGLWYLPVVNQGIFQIVGAMKNNFKISVLFLLLVAALQILVNLAISICLSLPVKKISAYSLIKE
ncbi:MAG: ABC transporter permease [Roseburia sp.]|nr:ABC transporter permease [Roseburia sp.]MCM1242322.1 ABC transporter permease [Roseburia sp.]